MESLKIGKKRYYTINQTESLTGIRRANLYKRIERGKIQALRISRFLFIEVETVKALTIERLKKGL